jgi:gluconate 2-dehydrogenase gamma chain
MSDADRDNPRRDFAQIPDPDPVVTLASTGLGAGRQPAACGPATASATGPGHAASAYQPSYFTAEEWAFINAAVARMIPADEQGPGHWKPACRNTSTAR